MSTLCSLIPSQKRSRVSASGSSSTSTTKVTYYSVPWIVQLTNFLFVLGMVTHVMHLSGFHAHNPLRTVHWDTLEKSLTVFILPPSSSLYNGTRRRLDLIFAPPEVYWPAVIGWYASQHLYFAQQC